jgi:ubiquinone/menaquinone biosynthesis C-methylase UbiE
VIEPTEKTGMRTAWGRVAQTYDDLWAERTLPFAERGLDLLNPPIGASGLDVGCGPGHTTLALARRLEAGSVVGVDFSPEMIDRAQSRWPAASPVTFQIDDAESLSLSDNAFDVVTSTFTLMYCYDALAAIGQMARVLRPGGHLLLVVWGRHDRVFWSPVIEIVETRAQYYSAVCPMMFFYGLPGVLPRMVEQMGLHVDAAVDVGTPIRFPSVEDAVRCAVMAGPLAGLFQNRLDESQQRDAWSAMTERVAAVATPADDGITVPGEALAVTARKPS